MRPRSRRPSRPRAPLVALVAGGALAVSAVALGCTSGAGRGTGGVPEPRRSLCLIASDSAAADVAGAEPLPADRAGATTSPEITAAFDDSADARRALLAASRLAPLRLDCEGQPRPGLARSWSRDTSGSFWTLVLDPRTDSTDSLRWTASTLAATWRADPPARAALQWAGVRSLVPLDDRRLVAGLTTPSLDLPAVFADRTLAVPNAAAIRMTLSPPGSGDLRDAIDQGTNLVQSRDPDLLDYARRRPGLTVAPLPWDRTYVLVLPAWSTAVRAALPADTAAFQAALAGDAVRGDARAAAGPFWWEGLAACPMPRSPQARAAYEDAIGYPTGDAIARALAERIVALAGAGVGSAAALTARAIPGGRLTATVRQGDLRGYVLRLPRHAPVPCREASVFPPDAAIVPLVDSRPSAVLQRGTPALAVEWDGALRPAP